MIQPFADNPGAREFVRGLRGIGTTLLSPMSVEDAVAAILQAAAPLLPNARVSILLQDVGLAPDDWAAGKTAGELRLPLHVGGRVAGVLTVRAGSPERALTSLERELADLLATLAVVALQRHRLEHTAMTDSLTGIGNRLACEAMLAREMARAERYGSRLSLAAFDVDSLKQINDRYGHAGGDAVLRHVGALARELVRAPDAVFRVGGDEFLAIFPETDAEGAGATAERVRRALQGWTPPCTAPETRVSASFGVASLVREEPLESLRRRADEALYEAKRSGRNRVKVWNGPSG
ncbi:MAG: sensor domain-containing diguanylate cyclase [Planctomycetes bacterium]|nr:sensor domain-containing diguanylate cyclase [Planctomycetota bacterium]